MGECVGEEEEVFPPDAPCLGHGWICHEIRHSVGGGGGLLNNIPLCSLCLVGTSPGMIDDKTNA